MSHTDLLLFFTGGTWMFFTFLWVYFFILFFILPFSIKQIGFRGRLIFELLVFYLKEAVYAFYFLFYSAFIDFFSFLGSVLIDLKIFFDLINSSVNILGAFKKTYFKVLNINMLKQILNFKKN